MIIPYLTRAQIDALIQEHLRGKNAGQKQKTPTKRPASTPSVLHPERNTKVVIPRTMVPVRATYDLGTSWMTAPPDPSNGTLNGVPLPASSVTPLDKKQATSGTLENAMWRIGMANPTLDKRSVERLRSLLHSTQRTAGTLSKELVDSLVNQARNSRGKPWNEQATLGLLVQHSQRFMRPFLAYDETKEAEEVGSPSINLGNRQMAAEQSGLLRKYEKLAALTKSRTGSMMYLDALLGSKPGYLARRSLIERKLQEIALGPTGGFGLETARRAARSLGFAIYPSKGEVAITELKDAIAEHEQRGTETSQKIQSVGAAAQKFVAREIMARNPFLGGNPFNPDLALNSPVQGPLINAISGLNPVSQVAGSLGMLENPVGAVEGTVNSINHIWGKDLDGKPVTLEDRIGGVIALLTTAAPFAKSVGPTWAKGKTVSAALDMARKSNISPIESYRVLRVIHEATSGSMDFARLSLTKATQSFLRSSDIPIPKGIQAANREFEMRIAKTPPSPPPGGKPPPTSQVTGIARGSQSGAPSSFWEGLKPTFTPTEKGSRLALGSSPASGPPLTNFDRITASDLVNLAYRYAEIGFDSPAAIAREIKRRIGAPTIWHPAVEGAAEHGWKMFHADRPYLKVKKGAELSKLAQADLSQFVDPNTGLLSYFPVFADPAATGIIRDPVTGARMLSIGSDVGTNPVYAGRGGWTTLNKSQSTKYGRGAAQSGGLGLVIAQNPESVLTAHGHHFYTVAYRAAVDKGMMPEQDALFHINGTLQAFGISPVTSIEGLAGALDRISARQRQAVVKFLGNSDFSSAHGLPSTQTALDAIADPTLKQHSGKVIGALHLDPNTAAEGLDRLVPSTAYPHIQKGTGLGRSSTDITIWDLYPEILNRILKKGGHEGNAKRSIQFGQTSRRSQATEEVWGRLPAEHQGPNGARSLRANGSGNGSGASGLLRHSTQVQEEIDVLEHNLRSRVGSWHRTRNQRGT